MRSVLLACLIIPTLIISGCNRAPEKPAPYPASVSPVVDDAVLLVSVRPVLHQSLPITVVGRGEMLPGDERELCAPFSAEIAEVAVSAGQEVTAGKVIVRLSTREIAVELGAAKEQLLAAQSRLSERLLTNPGLSNRDNEEISQLHSQRDDLAARRLSGEIDFDEYSRLETNLALRLIVLGAYGREVAEIQAGIGQAQRDVDRLERDMAGATIRAPINGTVELNDLYPGKRVTAGECLATIRSFTPSRVRVSLLERDVLRVTPGQSARVRIGVGGSIVVNGVVDAVLPERSPQGGFEVELLIYGVQTPQLKGIFAEAEIQVDLLPDRLLVPVESLLRENENYYVFVIDDGVAWWRWLEIGARSGGYVEVTPDPFTATGQAERIHGVDAGEMVAVAGHTLLSHKGAVVVEDEEDQ